MTEYGAGFIVSLVIAAAGWRHGSLTPSGAAGAVLVGTAATGAGWGWALILVTFFVLSSGLSRVGEARKVGAAEVAANGGRRDLGQVVANGGLALALALGARLFPHAVWFYAFLGAMAAVNADTWSTEIGSLSRQAPRLITSGRPVPPGASGGVTLLGTGAGLLGGLCIGLTATLLQLAGVLPIENGSHSAWLAVIGLLAGLFGGGFDSFLGATVQALYRCPTCDRLTERHEHRCGSTTVLVRGYAWFGNGVVNFLASVAGAVTGALSSGLLPPDAW